MLRHFDSCVPRACVRGDAGGFDWVCLQRRHVVSVARGRGQHFVGRLLETETTPYSGFPFFSIIPMFDSSFHFLSQYPYITFSYRSTFQFLSHDPYITLYIYYSSCHFLFQYPYITPIVPLRNACITPITPMVSIFFHYPYIYTRLGRSSPTIAPACWQLDGASGKTKILQVGLGFRV